MNHTNHSTFVKIKGRDFVLDGNPIRFRGFNIGGWLLLEHHMMPMPHIDREFRAMFVQVLGKTLHDEFFGNFNASFFTDTDASYLKNLGCNLVRLPFGYSLLEDDGAPGQYKQEGWDILDRTIAVCKRNGLHIVLDLHAVQGAQALDINSDCVTGRALFWSEADNQRRFCNLWSAIANRYKDETAILGYDLMGEPVCDDPLVPNHALYQSVMKSAIAAVRKFDSNHILILEANLWGRAIESINEDLLADPQLVYSPHEYFHRYFPNLKKYPNCLPDKKKLGKADIWKILARQVDEERIERPVYVGEFGTNYSNGLYAFHQDCAEMIEEHGYSWTIWCYKDIGKFGFVNPKPDHPWRRFVSTEEMLQKERHIQKLTQVCWGAEDSKKDGRLLKEMERQFPEVEVEWMRHRVREVWRDLEVIRLRWFLQKLKTHPAKEIAEMGRAYAFENCIVNPKAEALYRKLLGTA